jgi:deoxyribose-phosphate aldolase
VTDTPVAAAAGRALALVDLTSLDEGDTEASTRALCARAVTPHGPVAAVCVMPAWVAAAADALAGSPVRVATVANFPEGRPDVVAARAATAQAVADGADEVDVVAPWRAWADGDHAVAERLIAACAAEAPSLKVILETGSLSGAAAARELAALALGAGADWVKTSTGKHGQGATPEAAQALLDAVKAHGAGGVKVSGGVRTAADAATYLALADATMGPAWATPETFRIGASSLVDDLALHLS